MLGLFRGRIGRVWNRWRRAGTRAEPLSGPDPIELTRSQWDQVERRMAEFLEDLTPFSRTRRCVIEAQALPLYLGGWTGVIALRLNGEVIWVPDEGEAGEIEVIQDELLRNLGLFQATKLHPDLTFLIPMRPADAIDCPDCGGMGKLKSPPLPRDLAERILCRCGGIGWLPSSLKP